MQGRRRGVATVIGGVLLAIAVMGLIVFAVLMLDRVSQLEDTLTRLSSERASSRLRAESIVGWWWVGSPHTSPGSLLVHLESRASEALALTGIAVVWSDGSHTVVDRNSGSLSALGVSATITYRDGSTSTLDSLPIGLPPGAKLDIVFNGYAAARKPVTVSVSLSGSTLAVSVLSLKNYTEVYGAGNTTPPSASLLASTSHTAGTWTITWGDIAERATVLEGLASTLSHTIVSGVPVSGTTASLERRDGDMLVVDGVYVHTRFQIVADNLIYATNFSQDVIDSGEWVTVRTSWSWESNAGISDGGLVGDSTSKQPIVAYPSALTVSPPEPFYVLAHVYPVSCDVWMYDELAAISLYDSTNDFMYLIGIECDTGAADDDAVIARWRREDYTYVYVRDDAYEAYRVWNTYIVYYWTGFIRVEYYNARGSYVLEARDTTVTPDTAGLAIYGNGYLAYFDNFIVSGAHPRWLNITVTLNGSPVGADWRVALYNGTGGLVAEAYTDTTGTASLDVLWQPIVWKSTIEVYNDTDTLQAVVHTSDFGFDNLYGGNSYEVRIGDAYSVVLTVESQVPTSIIPDLAGIDVWYAFSANTSADYVVSAYNWAGGFWSTLARGAYTAGGTVEANVSTSIDYVNPVNGSIVLKLTLHSSQPIRVNVDVLNAVYSYYNYTVFNALLVGVGGTSLLDVYEYSPQGLSHLYTINAGSVFDGSTVVAYDPIGRLLVLANTTGVYVGRLMAQPGFSLVSADCTTAPGPAVLEVVNTTSNSYAVIVKSDGGYCVVDLSTNTTIASGTISIPDCSLTLSPPQAYMASARDPSGLNVFLVGYCADSGQAVLLGGSLQGTTMSWSRLAVLPGSRSAGLVAEDSSTMWLMLSGGSLYKVYYNATLGVWEYSLANASLPFTPVDPGDRLEVLDPHNLVFVRADYTNEVWRIPKS